jgi:hypothetical protein
MLLVQIFQHHSVIGEAALFSAMHANSPFKMVR